MRWYRIPTPRIAQPTTGGYQDWKYLLAGEGNRQCVYCAVADTAWGGYRIFHVEHYRPKDTFPDLCDIIENLFYSCPVCNVFKGNDWPGDPSPALDSECYPDPCVTDYNTLFSETEDGELEGRNTAARYVVERLYLNRAQLILERREAALDARFGQVIEAIAEHRERLDQAPVDLVDRLATLLLEITALQQRRRRVQPYERGGIERPRKSGRSRD